MVAAAVGVEVEVEVDVRVEDEVVVVLRMVLLLVVGSCWSGEIDDVDEVIVLVEVDDVVVGVDVATDVGCVVGVEDAVGEAVSEWTGVTPSEDRSNGLGDGDALVNGGAVTGSPADT